MKVTHHKNGEIKTLVDEAPYHPGYEDAGFKAEEMNNEPVAWMDKRTNKCVVFINTPPSDDWIPLYTHPAKTLTEWEMKECWEEATEGREHFCSQYFDFAQLILRKAQEK
jgi:hypothetical protein